MEAETQWVQTSWKNFPVAVSESSSSAPEPDPQIPAATSRQSVGEGHCWGSFLLQIIEQLDSCPDYGNLKLVLEIQSHFLNRPLGVFNSENM